MRPSEEKFQRGSGSLVGDTLSSLQAKMPSGSLPRFIPGAPAAAFARASQLPKKNAIRFASLPELFRKRFGRGQRATRLGLLDIRDLQVHHGDRQCFSKRERAPLLLCIRSLKYSILIYRIYFSSYSPVIMLCSGTHNILYLILRGLRSRPTL